MPHAETATYLYFKTTGKWKYDGKGASIPLDGLGLTHQRILELNGGEMPGIVSKGADFIIVVIDPESFPRLVFPERIAKLIAEGTKHDE